MEQAVQLFIQLEGAEGALSLRHCLHLNVNTLLRAGQCLRNERMPHLLMETKDFSLQRAKLYRHPENRSEIMMLQASPLCQNVISA